MTLGAIFTPTLAAELKISLGSLRQSPYLRRSQLFFTWQTLLTTAILMSPVQVSFFCRCLCGAAIWSRLCSSHFIGLFWCSGNEWETGLWKGRESYEKKKSEYFFAPFARMIFCDIWNVSWIIHGWLVTAKKIVGVTVHFQNVKFIKHAFFI